MEQTRVTYIRIHDDRAGQRIDNFLMAKLKNVPKSHIYRILRKGEVRVNKKRVKPDYKLQDGDECRIPPVKLREKTQESTASNFHKDLLINNILYQDKGLLILNKPAGMAVHGGSGIALGIIETLRQIYPHSQQWELVHRLDKDTSGCLMIAKKRSYLRELHKALREDKVEKHYLALVMGLTPATWKVNEPLLKNTLASGERMVVITPDGKPALTQFRCIESYEAASLIRAKPVTGRTHQIRVHAACKGYPIAGDPKYGDKTFNKKMREKGCKRLFLHASSLRIPLPNSEQMLHVIAPLPDALNNVLSDLQQERNNG